MALQLEKVGTLLSIEQVHKTHITSRIHQAMNKNVLNRCLFSKLHHHMPFLPFYSSEN